ncbi:Hypothetical predicted protein [Paramuricea clavata]|uniref:Uncharacterized protein n=1 Tax=Paramuricea clavata TaxID=317549 RepID=A0A6S7GCX5_PARCT|nr:Hypothetical predicted protein [Paramuricea clavata]
MKVIVDTVNLLNKSVFKEIQKKNPNVRVQSSQKKVFPHGTNTPLELIDEFEAQITAISGTATDVSAVLNKHKNVFDGMDNHKDKKVKLPIDPDVQPVAQKARRIPYSMKDQKTGDVRLVLDMRIPNQTLVRSSVQMPTVDDILHKIEVPEFFTEVDLSQGFLQITLAEESRHITAFPRPDDENPNCPNISDNIWLSKNKKEHLRQLDQLLETFEENRVTLMFAKCSFPVQQISVFGHIVSKKGIQPDKMKVEAVVNAPKPKSAAKVRIFLGFANYCSRYIPDYSSVTYPLRQLTKENVCFHWDKAQDVSFQKLKEALSSAPVLIYYNLSYRTRLVVDASPWALGAVL